MKRSIPWALAVIGLAALAACARPPALRTLKAGVAAALADDWGAAVRHWTEAVRMDPRSAAAHNNLAIAHEKRGDWEAARAEYEAAVGLDPDDLTIRTNHAAFKARLESARGKRP
jgi:Flp pilus assembly protein TadD